MLREELRDTLKKALKDQDKCTVATVRLILAALKDRDIAARGKGDDDGIVDDEIISMLQTMVRQREDSIMMFEQGGRAELAQREREEITVLEQFLPRQLDDTEIEHAVREAISQTAAASLKDMGKVMTSLRAVHAGEMNFGRASELAKRMLTAV
jgi:uncharacterized protein YqeY